MLTIKIPDVEYFDEALAQFIKIRGATVQLEHSLTSLSKWESVWEKPFLGPEEKTQEQVVSYIQMMVLTPDVPPEIFDHLSGENYRQINEYINAKRSATWFVEKPASGRPSREIVTSEVIYYWMASHQIPYECETWHINRLMTLIRVCNEKNAPQKKAGPPDLAARRALNEQRKAQMQSRG